MQQNLTLNKQKALKLSKQAQGTLNKVIAMIEKGEYCPRILQQIQSSIGLMETAKKELLSGHLNACVVKKIKENEKEAIEELLKIFNLSK